MSPAERRQVWLIALVLLLVTTAIYAPTFVVPYNFVSFDDQVYITHNQPVMTGLNAESIGWAATNPVGGNWHPITVLSHMLDVELYGDAPRGHHLTNVLLHVANGVLLFLVLRSMTSAIWPSALVAALFAWHPLRVESVAWVSERKDVLSMFFLLLTLAAYTRYARRGGRAPYLAMCVSFALGLMSKPMLVTLPFAMLLLDVWPLRRIAWLRSDEGRFPVASLWNVVVEKLPLLALVAISIATTLWAQTPGISNAPLAWRAANAINSYCAYIGQLFVPYPLYLPYLFVERSIPIGWTIAGAVALVATTGLVIATLGRWPFLAVGWFWYLGTLVPVIGLVQVGEQSMADRYTYVPLIGLGLMLAWSLAELARRGPVWQRAIVATTAAGLVVLVPMSIYQVTRWRDSETLFGHTLRYSPRNHVAYTALATEAFYGKDYETAARMAKQTLEFSPNPRQAMIVLAQSLARTGQTGEAISAYQQAVAMNPDKSLLLNEFARLLATCDDERFRNGSAAVRMARVANVKAGGQNPAVLDTLAAAYAEMGAWQQAIDTAVAAHAMAEMFLREGNPDAEPLVRGLEARLALYRQQKAYHVPLGVWEY